MVAHEWVLVWWRTAAEFRCDVLGSRQCGVHVGVLCLAGHLLDVVAVVGRNW